MYRFLFIAFALIAAAATPVLGAEDHDHDSKHGGVVVEIGHHHLEVIARDGLLEVHVTGEDDKPEDVGAANASAVVLSEGKKVDVALAAAGGNLLKGTGAFRAAKGTTIVITLTMPDHAPEQVRVELD